MPRQARIILSKSYYHIMTRGNNRNRVFREDSDFIRYLEVFESLKKAYPFDLYHYCLMPNHTHFLVRIKMADEFSNFMKRLNLIYFYYFKKKYGWVGHFWQDRFKSQPVGKDSYFIQCGKYIELNPVRAGLVDRPQDYKYSSFRHYVTGSINNLVTEDIFFHDLGNTKTERQKEYSDMVIQDIVMNTYIRKVWGSDDQRYNEARKIKYNLKNNYQN